MVDSISVNQTNVDELRTGHLQQQQQVEKINRESAGTQKSGIADLLFDSADISDEAMSRLESEKELMKYASFANRMDEPFDSEKVSHFKALFESGRIGDYLKNLDNELLAGDMLNNSLGTL